ncbi:MAG TPA: Xaa-Pro aminopeptidase, partial [Vicinamibacteria bacterium]|nr:Xaa-Pro aminopeptidase [Vicinamibacteria bacterium]
MKRAWTGIVVLMLAATAPLGAAPPRSGLAMPPPLPPLREQDRVRQEWLKTRLNEVLPALMRQHGVEMWLVVCREYNEDPVFFSLVAPSVMAARRRTILVFHDRGDRVDRLALGGGGSAGLYEVYRDPALEGRELWGQGQWALLRKLVDERKPRNIAVNVSHTHAFSDGLSVGEWEQLAGALGPWTSRVVRAERLAHDYVAVRVPDMLPTYRHLMAISHALIARAFSSEVIKPGVTTTDDVVWWLRQQVNDMGLGEWFPPSVSVQRPGEGAASVIADR